MARSHMGKLLEFLENHGGKARLSDLEAAFGWNAEKVTALLNASGGGIKWANLGPAPGVAQVLHEIGGRGAVPLYGDVRRVLESSWRKRQHWQAAVALDTALGGRASTGVWTRPDCVLAYYPARRRDMDESSTLATFEIEAPGQFDIRSVYEAHAHGLGADFGVSCRFCDGDDGCRAPGRCECRNTSKVVWAR